VKTAKGRRRIDLSDGTIQALSRLRKAALVAGRMEAPVFHDDAGGYLRLSNVYRDIWKPLLRAAGLNHVGLYSLRHTCATLLLLAGEPAKVVSERLGLATVTLTLDTYSHVLPSMGKRAADAIGIILDAARRKRPKKQNT
jgi:integrase